MSGASFCLVFVCILHITTEVSKNQRTVSRIEYTDLSPPNWKQNPVTSQSFGNGHFQKTRKEREKWVRESIFFRSWKWGYQQRKLTKAVCRRNQSFSSNFLVPEKWVARHAARPLRQVPAKFQRCRSAAVSAGFKNAEKLMSNWVNESAKKGYMGKLREIAAYYKSSMQLKGCPSS